MSTSRIRTSDPCVQRSCRKAGPFLFYPQQRPYPTAEGVPPSGGGDKRGQGHRMVPLPPLDSPQTLLWTRLPSVARLKARDPQGRLVLQGSTLDRSGVFRSVSPPLCTVWPRTVMRGKSRKGNSGHNSVPKSARRPELCSRNSRFAAHLRCVSAKEGKGSQEGTGNHVWCPVPFCPCRWVPTPPGCRRRPMCTLTSSVKPPPAASRRIGGRSAVC